MNAHGNLADASSADGGLLPIRRDDRRRCSRSRRPRHTTRKTILRFTADKASLYILAWTAARSGPPSGEHIDRPQSPIVRRRAVL